MLVLPVLQLYSTGSYIVLEYLLQLYSCSSRRYEQRVVLVPCVDLLVATCSTSSRSKAVLLVSDSNWGYLAS